MRVSAILKGYKDSEGRQTVFIRTSDGKKRTFKATKIKLKPEQFEKGKVIKHERAKVLNDSIRTIIAEIELGKVFNSTPVLFSTYIVSCINEWDKQKKPSTLRQIKSEGTKLCKFSNPLLTEITSNFLNRYKAYCFSLGNSTNSVWKTFKTLRLILRKAHREKLIQEIPIFEMPRYIDPQRHYLTRDQVDKIDKYSEDGPYKIPGTWFVISCLTGLRYSDQISFNKGKIKGGRLIIYTSKTGTPVSIKLNDKLKSLFERVDYKPLSYSGVHYNRIIRAIAAHLKLKDLVSSHQGRHTFGTLCASAGISQEVTAKLMGHQNLKTTGIYYQLTGVTLDSELEKLF
jgi:Site-specific recombinase XerD